MRRLLFAGTAALLMAGPALAQSTYQQGGCYRNGIPDCGPRTPGADSAFAGGGLVLVNPSGGPPPRATQPLPPPPPGSSEYYMPR